MELIATDLTPSQTECVRRVLEEQTRNYFWGGSIRSGKTVGACLAIILYQSIFDSTDFFLAGKSLGSVNRNVIPYMKAWTKQLSIPSKHIRSAESPRFLVGSNTFYLFGGNDVSSADTVQGLTAAGGIIDEGTLVPDNFFQALQGRCSVTGSKIITTFNKQSPFHWLKKDYIDVAQENGYAVLDSHISENHHLAREVVSQIARTMYGHFAARWIDNRWAAASGLVYPVFQTVTGTSGRGDAVSVDWGWNTTCALLWQRQASGGYVIAQEHYHRSDREGSLPEEKHLDLIEGKWGAPNGRLMVVDPSAPAFIWKAQQRGWAAIPGDNDIDRGINLVGSVLNNGSLKIDEDGCPWTLAEMGSYAFNPKTDKPIKVFDHAMDAKRYGAMALMVNPWAVIPLGAV